MKRKYVSVLSVIKEVSTWFADKDNMLYIGNHEWRNTGNTKSIFQVMANDIELPVKKPQKEHPLDMFRRQLLENDTVESEKEDGKVREIELRQRVYDRIPEGQCLTVPYILETEFLKHSDFPITETELNMLDQLLTIEIFLLGFISDEVDNYSTALIEELTKKGMIYDLSLNEDGDTNKTVVDLLMKKIYDGFEPLKISSNAYLKKIGQLHEMILPQSSLEALAMIDKAYPDQDSTYLRNLVNATYLTYMPLIMVYHLLELDTEELKAYDCIKYEIYRTYIARHLWPDMGMDYAMLETDSFSYGHAEQYDVEPNDDEILIKKIFKEILSHIKAIAEEENITRIPIDNINLLESRQPTERYERGTFQVLLNKTQLDWGSSE